MGQSGYAENFINLMLGWIRSLASSIAGMFQYSGAQSTSSGAALLNWFTQNWVGLLITLIVLGVLVDWVVWMMRWRPYWLWFRKRRIVLDDDIDDSLSEKELAHRYGMEAPQRGGPRFHSEALRRGEAEYAYGEDEDAWDEGAWEGEDGEDYSEFVSEYMDEDDEAAGADGVEEAGAQEEEAAEPQNGLEDGWDDAPRKREKKRRLFGRSKKMQVDDPFAEDDEAFGDLDDDFFEVVSEAPRPEMDEDLRMYARPERAPDKGEGENDAPVHQMPLAGGQGAEPFDERIGYQNSFEPMTGTARSRKSRRRQQEENDDV